MGTSSTLLQYVMSIVWVHSFIELDLFDTNVPFGQYHSDLSDQSALEIQLHYFSIFFTENINLPRISR